MNGEPIGKEAIKGGVLAVIAFVAALGFPISDELQTAIIGLIPFAVLVYTWWFARKKTVTVTKANEQIEAVAKQDAIFNEKKIDELKFTEGS